MFKSCVCVRNRQQMQQQCLKQRVLIVIMLLMVSTWCVSRLDHCHGLVQTQVPPFVV